MELKKFIKNVPDFPKKGIIFRDISPLLANGEALAYTIDKLVALSKEADIIVGPDARGFLFGTPVATILKKPFIMVRKAGKLPGEVIRYNYKLEYKTDILEIQKNAIKPGKKVIIIDDLLATGGTTRAIVDLIKSQGAIILKVLFVIELKKFNGRKKYYDLNTISLIKY